MQGKSEDDNAAMRTLYLRAFARNSDDCYKDRFERERLRFRTEHICQILRKDMPRTGFGASNDTKTDFSGY